MSFFLNGHALNHEFLTFSVETPQGLEYEGVRFAGNGLCGVSILRSG